MSGPSATVGGDLRFPFSLATPLYRLAPQTRNMSIRLSQLAVKRVAAAPVRLSRSAGGGTHYNPPTGYLFGEKVSNSLSLCV